MATPQYLRFLRGDLPALIGHEAARAAVNSLQESMSEATERSKLTIAHLPALWPLLHQSGSCGVLFAVDDQIVGWDDDESGKHVHVEAIVKGRSIARAVPSKYSILDEATVDWRQRSSAYTLKVPKEHLPRDGLAVVTVRSDGGGENVIYLSRRGSVLDSVDVDGVSYVRGNKLLGWAWDRSQPNLRLWVSLLINGKYWRRVRANQVMRASVGAGPTGSHAFEVSMPAWVPDRAKVDCVVEGSNMRLRRSPSIFSRLAGKPGIDNGDVVN